MDINDLFAAALQSLTPPQEQQPQVKPMPGGGFIGSKPQEFNYGIKNDLIQLLIKYKYDVNRPELQFVISSFLQQLSNF